MSLDRVRAAAAALIGVPYAPSAEERLERLATYRAAADQRRAEAAQRIAEITAPDYGEDSLALARLATLSDHMSPLEACQQLWGRP